MDEFCVSERTIRRDIEFLAYHYNIQSFSGRYGGYKLLDMDDYKEKKKENRRIKVDTLKEILKTCDEKQKPVIESILNQNKRQSYIFPWTCPYAKVRYIRRRRFMRVYG